jgi:hypothetical protein
MPSPSTVFTVFGLITSGHGIDNVRPYLYKESRLGRGGKERGEEEQRWRGVGS